jgi:dCMP deaminase
MIKIGVTGLLSSGKDSFAEYLKSKGFEHISLSDMIRDELRRRNLPLTRDYLQRVGNEMREKEGNNVLAKRAVAKMDPNKKYIITSIRNPMEVKELSTAKQFVFIKIEASPKIRFERMSKRIDRRESDPKTYEEFLATEARELSSSNENSQQLSTCMKMAKFSITNESTQEEFNKKINELLPILEQSASYIRPSWDEYFIELMQVVGKRGTCNRGRSGAIIVKDKRVIATGYVGAPPGLAHCDEVGHWFKKTIHETGEITQHCIRTVHAEANAIAQAAKFGTNIEGSTLYCKMEPCLDCTKLLIAAGIKRVVAEKKYQASTESREMLEEAGVKLEVVNKEVESYSEQK